MSLFNQSIHRLLGLAALTLALAGCGGGSGGGGDSGGGFTGAEDTIDIEVEVNRSRVPTNVTGEGPNPELPFVSTIRIKVTDEEGRLQAVDQVTIDLLDPELGSLFTLSPDDVDDNGNPAAFKRIVIEDSSGNDTVFFLPGTVPGTARVEVSVIDSTNAANPRSQTALTRIEIFDNIDRTTTSLRFTGPYVNAVAQGASRFGSADGVVANGTYQRVVSVVATNVDGQPTGPNTEILFFLIDSPLEGFPQEGPGRFEIAGPDGDPQEGGTFFSGASENFVFEGVIPGDRLVLDGRERSGRDDAQNDNRALTGIYTIDAVLNATQLRVRDSTAFPTNPDGDNGATVPFVVGRAERATILSRGFTDLTGVTSTILTYPADLVGRTAILVACVADDRDVCTVLNTCDASGANCNSVFLPVSDGTNVTLTTSDTELGPNTTTAVRLCLRDPNFTPLQATPIRYNIPQGTGTAVITINGSTANSGTIPTGADGCGIAVIESAGQAPGTDPISIFFSADGVEEPVEVQILGPGAGRLTGTVDCEGEAFNQFQNELGLFEQCSALSNPFPAPFPSECSALGFGVSTPSGDDDPELIVPLPPRPPEAVQCTITLFLQDDRGGPIPGVLITVGDFDGDLGDITFNPAAGSNSGVTDANGENRVGVLFGSGGASSITLQAGGAEFSFSLDLSPTAQ